MSDSLYHEHLLERYKEPSTKGKLDTATHTHALVNSSCGDEVTIELEVGNDGQIIAAAWDGNGCSLSQVAADVLCEKIAESHFQIEQVSDLTLKNIEEWLELPTVSPGRIKCLSLGLVATKKALEESTE